MTASNWTASEITAFSDAYIAEHKADIDAFGEEHTHFLPEPSASFYFRRHPIKSRDISPATEKLIGLLVVSEIADLIKSAHKRVEDKFAERAAKRK